MSDVRETVYLFKGSRRPLYRQQNLHLLGADRGTVAELAWNRSWVAPEYFEEGTLAPGTPAVFVLTDRPYALFVPVRRGSILEARWEELSLRVWVGLETWLRLGDVDAAAYSQNLRTAQHGNLPGEKFVARRRDDTRLVACFDEEEDAGWRAAIDGALQLSALSDESAYADSVFFRSAGVRLNGIVLQARRDPLEPGSDAELLLRFHNPHLSDERLSTLSLRATAAKNTLRVEAPPTLPRAGEIALRIRALTSDAELNVQVVPNPAQHTSLTLRFPSRRVPPGTGAARPDQRNDLLALYGAFLRCGPIDAERELRVLEAFLRVLPAEHRVAERRALVLARTGDDAGAYDVLRSLDAERLHDEARLLLFRLHARRGNVTAAAALFTNLDLAEESRRERLLQELSQIDSPQLDRVVRELTNHLSEDQDIRAVIEGVGSRLVSPELIAECARSLFLVTSDARWAAAFLLERIDALHLAGPVITDALLDLAQAGGLPDDSHTLRHLLQHRISNLLGVGEVADALGRLRQALPSLSRTDRNRLFHAAADRLHDMNRHADASALLVELAYAACETGDLAEATEAIERARGMLAPRGLMTPPPLRAAIARVEAAWAELQPLTEWRVSERERRAEALHHAFRNRAILLVGGLKRDHWQQRLEQLTGARIDFGESFRTERDDLDALAQRIRSGRYAAVVFRWMHSGHDVARLKKVSEDAGVLFIYAEGGGLRGVEDALWNEINRT